MSRALRLYWLAAMEMLHRLRYEWAREIVVFIASLILFATFLYVFNDFLNVQVSSLSQAMRDQFASVTAIVTLAAGTAAAAAALRRQRFADQSLERTALTLGELPPIIRVFLTARTVTTLAIMHGLTWFFVTKTMLVPSLERLVAIEALMTAASLTVAFLIPGRPKGAASAHTDDHAPATNRMATLTRWRLAQLLRRNRLTRLILGVAAVLIILLATIAGKGAPTFACIALAMTIGYVTSLTLVFQVAEDLPGVWTERGLGVTHDQFVGTYERLGLTFAGASGLLSGLAVALGRLTDHGTLNPGSWNDIAKVLCVTAIPCLILPWIMLQIDVRRPAINAILVLIAGLFLGTAIYAHWLSLLLPVILRYYALTSQAGRFYRA